MINAVTNRTVPHLTVIMGASYGAGNYGMCGRAYDPRFLFTWPNAKIAVMGPQQLAGVMSIVRRSRRASAGRPFDEEADDRVARGGRGADRARVACVLHERQAVRRRDHRPARHPHRARHRALGRALQRRSRAAAASASSGCESRRPTTHPIRKLLIANRGEIARRIIRTAGDGHRHRRGVLRRRRRRAVRAGGRRGRARSLARRGATRICDPGDPWPPSQPPVPTPCIPATASSRSRRRVRSRSAPTPA